MTGVPDRGEGRAENLSATASQSLSPDAGRILAVANLLRLGHEPRKIMEALRLTDAGKRDEALELLTGQRHSADHRKDSP